MSTPTSSDIRRQRRARAWLDDNTSDWGRTTDAIATFYAYVHGYDEPIYATSLVLLCIEGCELNGDTFRP